MKETDRALSPTICIVMCASRAMRDAAGTTTAAGIAALIKQEAQQTLSAWAEKNHHGKMWKAGSRRRWFVMTGFHVHYYTDEQTAGRCGTFDLRNVRVLHDSIDTSAPAGAIDIVLSEKKGGGSNKVVTMVLIAGDKGPWLRHMCSAASDDALPPAMRCFRSVELATALDNRFATQKTASSTYGAAQAPRTPRRSSSTDVTLPGAMASPSSASMSACAGSASPQPRSASKRMSASGLFRRLSLASVYSPSTSAASSRRASVASRHSSTDEASADEATRSESWMYTEDTRTWLPPASRRLSDSAGQPAPATMPGTHHSDLLDQIHKYAGLQLEEGSAIRRRSLGMPSAGLVRPERGSTIPFPSRGSSFPVPAAAFEGFHDDLPTTPLPVSEYAEELEASALAAASDAQWTCGACTLLNDAARIRCVTCDALRGSELVKWL